MPDWTSALTSTLESVSEGGRERAEIETFCRRFERALRGTTDEPAVSTADVESVLNRLRSKRQFEEMEPIGDAAAVAGLLSDTARGYFAQALIENGRIASAQAALQPLLDAGSGDDWAEALGLMGRAYKQAGVLAGPEADAERKRLFQLAFDCYREQHETTGSPWTAINMVALSWALGDRIEALTLAEGVIEVIDEPPADAWAAATIAEALVARGDRTEALRATEQLVARDDIEPFQAASFHRQLTEIWGMAEGRDGTEILGTLQAYLARSPLGASFTADEVAQLSDHENLEASYGELPQQVSWLADGLALTKSVVKIIDTSNGRGHGSGVIVRADKLFGEACADEVFVMTNAHVVSDDPSQRGTAIGSADASVHLERASTAGKMDFDVAEIVWTSGELDCTVLRIAGENGEWPPSEAEPVPSVARRLPRVGSRAYVIGHPGGEAMKFSLHDNKLVWASNDPCGKCDDCGGERSADCFPRTLVQYRAPTTNGSSGSPVFNENWDLIALHHAGDQRVVGGSENELANEGISIAAIRAAATEQGLLDPNGPGR